MFGGLHQAELARASEIIESHSLPSHEFALRANHSFSVHLPNIPTDQADSTNDPRRSTWLLLEDNRLLGPPHALHRDIESIGQGRYSHWQSSLIFSTSDKSDPRTNGRTYTLVKPDPDALARWHFLGQPEPLLLDVGDRLYWPSEERFEFFVPAYGRSRSSVNPARPQRIDAGWQFDAPGEYYLRSPSLRLRLLVLDPEDEPDVWLRQINAFVAANITGGKRDEPDWQSDTISWSAIDRDLARRLFESDRSLDVQCGLAARLFIALAASRGFEARYCHWFAAGQSQPAHIGAEVRTADEGQWTYFDPHFGFYAADRKSALDFWLMMRWRGPDAARQSITMQLNKYTLDLVSSGFDTFTAGIGFNQSPASTARTILLADESLREQWLDTDRPDEVLLIAPADVPAFRAAFYAPARRSTMNGGESSQADEERP